MAKARPIDIIVPPGEENWLKIASPKRFLLESSIGIVDPSIVIDDFGWKTLPSGRQIMIRKGDASALNGNDMRKINIAIDAAIKNPSQLGKIREELLNQYIPDSHGKEFGWKQDRVLLTGAGVWVNSSNSEEGANMAISNNLMKGRGRYEGLTKRQSSAVKRQEEFESKYPDKDMMKAVSVSAAFSRGMAKEKFGSEPFTVYRGIYGDQAIAIKAKAKKGDTIRMNTNSLSSFTTNKKVAEDFKKRLGDGKPGIVIKAKVSYKNVFDSYVSNPVLTNKTSNYDEIIVGARGMKVTGVIIDD